ncbi:MAG: sugar phosphate isomerase/epimerase, partial [Acidimicrobiaceae bacterium]|nr:sugar phosphate isomerase/epimerase [Acidimicrobiaceae bacterium]
MNILLGVDTLSYHCRLVEHEISLEEVVRECAELGAAYVQLNAIHLKDYDEGAVDTLVRAADDAGISLTLSGDVVGRANRGDTVAEGAARVKGWVELAERLGSPFARVSSGFYRNELLGHPEQIAAEQRYVIDALRAATEDSSSSVKVLLENHSDFTAGEYIEIIQSVDGDRVGVFLDIINPISVLLDPLPVVTRLAPWAPAGHAKDFRMVSHYVPDRFHRTGFDVQFCYPGEGVADLPSLVGVLRDSPERDAPYRLSIEG